MTESRNGADEQPAGDPAGRPAEDFAAERPQAGTGDAADGKPGKGKPPKEKQFRPGTSGNPKGRPKGSRNFKTAFTDMMKRPVTIRENGKPRKVSGQDALLLGLFDAALRGDAKSKTQLINMGVKFGSPDEEPPGSDVVSANDRLIIDRFLQRNAAQSSGALAATKEDGKS